MSAIKISELFHCPKRILCASSIYPPSPLIPDIHYLFTVSVVLPSAECHVAGIIHYVAFSDWHLSLSDMHLGLLHVWLGGWLGAGGRGVPAGRTATWGLGMLLPTVPFLPQSGTGSPLQKEHCLPRTTSLRGLFLQTCLKGLHLKSQPPGRTGLGGTCAVSLTTGPSWRSALLLSPCADTRSISL